ncbi:MAG: Non-ribosomal peptide synthetase component, partial [Chthonomonadales bacterium]|nr:Non-ribosomal peptide synthetase component [Chthonomonadales bacterium]
MPYLDCRHVDLTGDSVAEDAACLAREFASQGDREVAYRDGHRLIPRLERVDLQGHPRRSSAPLKSGGLYLLTGGLGGIALVIARYLLKRYDACLLLVGRTPLPERADWSLPHPPAVRERIEALQSLEALSSKVRYEAADVCAHDQLAPTVSQAEAAWGRPLDGVFHLAGLYRDRLLVEETAESMAAALRPKMTGALALHRLLEDRPACLFIAFSSTTSFFGGAMFGAYAAANRFLDHFCHWRAQELGRPTHCFAWSTWNEIGMNRTVSGKEPLRATGRGFQELTAEQGMNSLLAGLFYDQPQLVIGLDGSNAYIRRHLESASPLAQQLCACFTSGANQELFPRLEAVSVSDRFGTPAPCDFVRVEHIPRLLSGAIDRLGLADLGRQALRGGSERIGPRNEPERRLATLWQDVLGVPQVGIHDNFFELGGHSLLATLVMSRLAGVFRIDLPARLLFESPTVAGLAAKIADQEADVPTHTQALVPVRRDQALPLSFAEQRFWFVEQLEPGSPAHNLSIATRLIGELDVSMLEQSLTEIFRRHEALRTTFPTVDGKPTRHIAPPSPVSLPIINLQNLSPGERESETLRLAAADLRTPFDIAQGPLLRIHLVRREAQDHALLVNVHHIIADGWSLGVFNQELSALYAATLAGQPSPLPELPIQYADYSLWQRTELERHGEALEKQLAYWKQQIEGVPTLLELPLDHPRPPVQTFRGAHQSFALSQELTERLKALCRQEGVTLFMTLMAAFQALLARYSGQERFFVSTGVANRNRKETEDLIGCFINILLLRADVTDNPSFRELLTRVRETALGAYANQDLPFEKLVEEVQPERDLSYNPLTQVMFVLLNAPIQSQQFPGIRTETLDIETAAAQYDLVIHMVETADGMTGYLDYYTDLFEPETISRMLGHFRTLLEAVVVDADLPVARIPLLTHAERQQLLVEFNASSVDFGPPQLLHRHFEAQAERCPDAPAVFFGDETLTYAALDARANKLAWHLQELGVGPDMLVGISVERSVEMVVGILGILKAGGAYVPLDPSYPQERLAFMLEDTGTKVLLTQAHLRDRLPQGEAQIVCLDSDWPGLNTLSPNSPPSDVTPENLSYVIYTSGSTGQPKGIAIRHAGVGNNLLDLNTRFDVGPSDRVLALSSLSFDMCVYEVLGALCAGAGIVMPAQSQLREPIEWAHLIQKHGVTLWNSAPALLKMLVDLVEAREDLWPRSLRLALLGGDWVPVTLPDRLKAMAPDLRFIVMGGATEASIHSTLFEVTETDPDWRSIPYGHAMANQTTFLLDGAQQLVPIGVPGELYLGGGGLGRGYWNRQELTDQKFLPHPFVPGERLYRTGDLARWRPDGEIELLGRIDYMVKIRGLRIELGEIEALLRRHPAVQEAVVAAKGPDSDKQLIAYVVLRQRAEAEERIQELRTWIKAHLPEYMTPAAFLLMDRLPLSPNGKVDRKALPLPEIAETLDRATFVAARTPTEEILTGIWADVLGIKLVGIHANFFEIGG